MGEIIRPRFRKRGTARVPRGPDREEAASAEREGTAKGDARALRRARRLLWAVLAAGVTFLAWLGTTFGPGRLPG